MDPATPNHAPRPVAGLTKPKRGSNQQAPRRHRTMAKQKQTSQQRMLRVVDGGFWPSSARYNWGICRRRRAAQTKPGQPRVAKEEYFISHCSVPWPYFHYIGSYKSLGMKNTWVEGPNQAE